MNILSYKKVKEANLIHLKSVTNSLGQVVDFFDDDENPIIGIIEETAFRTDFFDDEDFYEGSDYTPVLVDGKVSCEFDIEY